MDYRIEEIAEIIRSDISRFPKVVTAAESLNMSVSRFHHLFKQEMQVSFAKYVKERKLEEARDLLITTHLSVKQVMVKIGGGNEVNFIRAFKQKYNETPGEYRKNHRIIHIH